MAKKICISCKESIDYESEFCIFCGARQPGGEAMKKNAAVSSKKMKENSTESVKKVGQKMNVPVTTEKKPEIKEKVEQVKKAEEKKKIAQQDLEQLKYKAFHDSLTGVKNRQAYDEDVKSVDLKNICFISVDVNNLKKVNDSMGHGNGDLLIKSAATALIEVFDREIYRVGGDEFIVISNTVGTGTIEQKEIEFQEKFKACCSNLGDEINFSAAFGYSFGDGIKTVKELVDEADALMYKKKNEMKQSEDMTAPTQEKKAESNTTVESYNSNFDGYYDDTEAKIENAERQLDKEAIKKTAFLIGGLILFLIIFELLI